MYLPESGIANFSLKEYLDGGDTGKTGAFASA